MTTKEKILRLRQEQPNIRASHIAKIVGVSRQRVLQVLQAMGLPTRPGPRMSRPEYQRWWNMLDRCLNPKNDNFDNYGARGITVCERWKKFDNFFADMGQIPAPDYTIERKDNNGNYTPSNCRWATKKEQGRNTRQVRLSKEQASEIRKKYANGKKQTALAAEYGVTQAAISSVVRGRTWS